MNDVSNLMIVVGYLLVPVFVLPYLPLTMFVKLSGVFFFSTCALTHAGHVFSWHHHGWMVINHVVQGVSVVLFVLGFGRLLRLAHRSGESLDLVPKSMACGEDTR